MKDSCYECKGKSGGPAMMGFDYEGMTVKIFKSGMICEACERKNWIKEYEREIKRRFGNLIYVSDGKVKVNWKECHKVFSEWRGEGVKEKFHSILSDVGVLSMFAEGNWEIVSYGPIGINPRDGVSYLYFTKKEDAIAYARLEKGNTLYHWEIHHIVEVIPKEKIVKEKD